MAELNPMPLKKRHMKVLRQSLGIRFTLTPASGFLYRSLTRELWADAVKKQGQLQRRFLSGFTDNNDSVCSELRSAGYMSLASTEESWHVWMLTDAGVEAFANAAWEYGESLHA